MKSEFRKEYLEMTLEEFWQCKESSNEYEIDRGGDDTFYMMDSINIYIGELSKDKMVFYSPFRDIIITRHKGVCEKYKNEHFFWIDMWDSWYTLDKEYPPTTKMSTIVDEIKRKVKEHYKDVLLKIKKYTSAGLDYVIDRVWNKYEFSYIACNADKIGVKYYLDEDSNMHITVIDRAED